VAILIGVIGVMTMSQGGKSGSAARRLLAWTEPSALIGIGSGSLFAITAVAIRAAALSLGGEGFLIQAALTLAVIVVLQTILLGAYLGLREPGQIARVIATWRVSALVGLTGVLGSAGWFTAMTLQNAAYVRTLGQVELVFTFLAAHYLFKERIRKAEVLGVALIVASIILLLNFR
jgi:drug/metabolite transporter (DMT)-like permease